MLRKRSPSLSATARPRRTGSRQPASVTDRERCSETEKRPVQRLSLAAALLIAIGTAAYSSSFRGVFVFDDVKEIGVNPAIRHLWPPGEAMFGGPGLPRRPLPYYTFAIDYALHGTDVWGYHAVNLAIHLAAGLALFGVIRRTLRMPRVPTRFAAVADQLALAAALIWVVHPLQTQAVTYVYQRMESLMGLIYLLTLYCFVRSATSPRPRLWLEAAVACCAAGMGTKEVMVTAPMLVLWYDRVFVARSWGEILRRRCLFYAAMAATWPLLYVVVRCQAYRYGEFSGPVRTPFEYALSQPAVILHYLRLTFFPRGQCLFDYWPDATSAAEIVIPGIIVSLLVAATGWCMFRRPALGFAAGSFFLILAPTSSIVPVRDLAFEHRMYLSLSAVAVMVVLGGYVLTDRFWSHLPDARRRKFRALSVASIVLALAATTYARNTVYSSYVGMWRDVMQKSPHNWEAYYNFGSGLLRVQRDAEAVPPLRQALVVAQAFPLLHHTPSFCQIHNNLGIALAATGRAEEARRHYETAINMQPIYAPSYLNLGNLLCSKDPRRARECYEKAIALNPAYTVAYVNLGALLGKTDPEAAYRYLQTALALDPENAGALSNIGGVLEERGNLPEALEQYERALTIDPSLVKTRENIHRVRLLMERGGSPRRPVRLLP